MSTSPAFVPARKTSMSSRSLRVHRLTRANRAVVSPRARLSLLTAILALPAASAIAQSPSRAPVSDEVVVLETLEVSEKIDNPAARDFADATKALKQVAGAAGIVSADVLAYQPGIFAQEADGWVVFGANAGYEPRGKNWKVYVDLRNLTDRNYASAISPTHDVAGADTQRLSPGDPFSVLGGFSIKF